jgi:uncharacterized membrane protein
MKIDLVTQRVVVAHDQHVQWRDFQAIGLGAAILAVLFGLDLHAGPLGLLRIALGLTYVLFVPGYCLMVALFPRQEDLDGVARLGASIGLSVALVSPLALLLDQLPWGIRPWPILIGEFAVCALFAAVALWRRARLPATEIYTPDLPWTPRSCWNDLTHRDRRLYGAGAIVLMLLAATGAWLLLTPAPDQFMTEFYILGADGQARDYPRTSAAGEVLTVTMGLVNREQIAHTYRVEVWVIDSLTPNRQTLVIHDGPISVAAGQKLERPIAWRMPWEGRDQRVEFRLFLEDGSQPYRQLRLWLNPTTPPPGENP